MHKLSFQNTNAKKNLKRKADVLDTPDLKYVNVFPAVITNLSDKGVISDIKNMLSSKQLSMFRKTCFGHFLDLDTSLKFSGVMAQSVLLREIEKADAQPEEMWFHLCGHEVRFSVIEFGLVMGLSFNQGKVTKQMNTNRNSVRYRYFTPGPITYGEMKEKFTTTLWETEDDEMAVKMSLLYCLNLFLLGADKRRVIEDDVLQMVDNLELFNAYPWGRRVWKMTYDSLSGALKGRYERYMQKLSTNPKLTEKFNLLGFPMAFKVSRDENYNFE